MTVQSLILRDGRQGGPYEGRIFASVRPASRMARLVLRELGAEQCGTSYMLPPGTEPRNVERLREAAAADLRALSGVDRDDWEVGCAVIEIRLLLASGRSGARDAARKRIDELSLPQRRILADRIRKVRSDDGRSREAETVAA